LALRETFATILKEYADVAQLVEQLIRNQQVNGSSPFVGSIISTTCDSVDGALLRPL